VLGYRTKRAAERERLAVDLGLPGFVMSRRMLRTIKRLAEAGTAR
jgi:hypothetical protein